MTPRIISVFDLAAVPGAIGIVQRNKKEEIDHLLFGLGFDIKTGYDFEDCFHRPLTRKDNQAVYGVRIVGVERDDREWTTSEFCSWENKLELTAENDIGMYDELKKMSREGADAAFSRYDSKNYNE